MSHLFAHKDKTVSLSDNEALGIFPSSDQGELTGKSITSVTKMYFRRKYHG